MSLRLEAPMADYEDAVNEAIYYSNLEFERMAPETARKSKERCDAYNAKYPNGLSSTSSDFAAKQESDLNHGVETNLL